MHSPERKLANELDELATTISAALARLQAVAAETGHIIHREDALLDTIRTSAPMLSAAMRTVAERLEAASCESVVFPNSRCGVESVVRPAMSGFSVVLRDTDADRTLPTIHRFSSRDEAIAKAKHLAGVR